jgi:hypothetical protein
MWSLSTARSAGGRIGAPVIDHRRVEVIDDRGQSDNGSKAGSLRCSFMLPAQIRNRPTVGQLARAHTFRFLTMIAAWVLIFTAFVYHPEWIRGSLRFMTHSIEAVADQVPEPWGARLEIMLRELGGIIWLQIAVSAGVLSMDSLIQMVHREPKGYLVTHVHKVIDSTVASGGNSATRLSG